MPGALVVITPPATEPVGLGDVKDWCRIDTGDNDATLTSMIAAASQLIGGVDGYSGLLLTTQTIEWSLPAFVTSVEFPRWPVQSIAAVRYVDVDGVEQTVDPGVYQLDNSIKPARLSIKSGQSWPAVGAGKLYPVTVRFVGGYGASDAVPEGLRVAVKALVAHWHENREPFVLDQTIGDLPLHVKSLVYPHRLHFGVG